MLDEIDAIVWEADVESRRFTYVSPAAERILGYPLARWAEPDFLPSILHPDDRAWVGRYCAGTTRTSDAHTLEYRVTAADGRTVWLRNTLSTHRDEGGERRCVGVMVDVTDRKQAEAALQRALALQEATLEATAAAVLVVDREDRLVRYNGAFAKMWGLQGPVRDAGGPPEARGEAGMAAVALRGDWDPARVLDKVRVPRLDPEADTSDVLETEDGRVFERCSRPLRQGDAVVGRVWTFSDITEHRALEADLRHAAEFEELYQSAPCAIHTLDADGVNTRVNETELLWLGRRREELVGRSFEEVLTPASRETFARVFPTLLRDGELGGVELEMVRADGSTFPVLMGARGVRDEAGNVRSSHVVLHGIEPMKRVEEALRREEERYRYVSLASSDAIYDRDLLTGRVERNAAYRASFAPGEDSTHALAWWEPSLHPDDREQALTSLHAAFRARAPTWSGEYRLRRRDGAYMTVLDRAYLLYDETGVPIRMIGAFSDITPRRAVEDALRKSEERFRTLARVAPVGIFHLDAEGRRLYINDRLWSIIGVEAQELADEGWKRALHPEDRERVLAGWEGVVRDARPWTDEYRFLTPGGVTTWVLCQVLPLKGPGGERLGFVGSVTDITDRKHTEEELRRHREHLEELVAERTHELALANRELESFSSSVSHDLRAPLRAIDGFSRLLEQDLGGALSPEVEAHIARIRQGAQRMALLIDDLLRLSRVSRAQLQCETVDLSALAREVANDLHAAAPERDLALSIQPGMVVEGDRPLLRILVDNLLGNAWKFTSRNPKAHIAFFAEEEGGQTVYRVRDDGVGFDPAFSAQLFQTFNRLHSQDEFEGTGIGLATVRRIVERHGGVVRADAALGRGATISFSLKSHCRR